MHFEKYFWPNYFCVKTHPFLFVYKLQVLVDLCLTVRRAGYFMRE